MKRILSLALSLLLVVGVWICVPESGIVSHSLTSNQQNIVDRANYLYNMKWDCLKTIDGWRGEYTFTKGNTYRLPYGQPIDEGYYVGYGVHPVTFLESTKDSGSVFYTKQSKYDTKYSTYYASDCSAYVSWCWSIKRTTTIDINDSTTGYGKATASNIKSYLQLGDALNSPDQGHVVLVTDITYDSGGGISQIEITEQTPPQLKRSYYTVDELASKYGSYYTIQRYTGTVEEAPTGKVTIRFQSNGGNGVMAKQIVEVGQKFDLPANVFKRGGRQFAGWIVYKEHNNKYYYTNGSKYGWYTPGSEPQGYYRYIYSDKQKAAISGAYGDVFVFRAVWGGLSYTIRYNSNGGTGTMKDTQHNSGQYNLMSANTFTKTGYTFSGWYLTRQSDGKTLYLRNGFYDMKWFLPGQQIDGYRVALYKDKGEVVDFAKENGDVITCKAQWTPNSTGTKTFYIQYNGNGGTGTMQDTKVVYGTSTATRKNTFVYEGATFVGWMAYKRSNDMWIFKNSSNQDVWITWDQYEANTSAYTIKTYSNGGKVSKTGSVDGDIITFYAIWNYTKSSVIKFDAKGGVGSMASQQVTYGKTTQMSQNTFTRVGYKFAGWHVYRESEDRWYYTNGVVSQWYERGNQPEGYSLKVYADKQNISKIGTGKADTVVMNAVWSRNPYTIKFDSNNGTGSINNMNMLYDTPAKLTANSFTKSANKFVGWTALRASDNAYYCVNNKDTTDLRWLSEAKLNNDYQKYVFANGETVSNLSTVNGDIITLSAVWKLLGDADTSGDLSVNDVTHIQKAIVHLIEVDDEFYDFADVTGDGKVSVKDASFIQLYLARKISTFPVCK